jgi:hypothetical protein
MRKLSPVGLSALCKSGINSFNPEDMMNETLMSISCA